MNRVAERVEDGSDVQVDLGQVRPEVAGRHHDELGEGAVTLDADPNGVGAQRPAAGHAVAAAPAHDVPLGADDLAWKDRGDAITQLHHLADELVPNHQRRVDGRLRPFVPALDVEVGAADSCAQDADQDLSGTWFGVGDVLQPQTGCCFGFDQRLHSRQDSGGSERSWLVT